MTAMTLLEHPGKSAECWFVNALLDGAVDVYVNYARTPAALEVGSQEMVRLLRLDGSERQPFQTHSVLVRWQDHARGRVLASASIELHAGRSFTAVLHPSDVPGSYRLSIYRNDFSPAGRACLEVRHVGFGPAIDWSLAPRRGTDITIPPDPRHGRLIRGQWQQAREVIENDYRLEARVQGRATSVLPQLQLVHERLTVAHYVGRSPSERRARGETAAWLVQQLRIPTGVPDQAGVTVPDKPASDTNSDHRIIFCAPPLPIVRTDAASAAVEARDPDGRVADLSIDRVDPDPGGITLPPETVVPSPGIGVPALGTLRIAADVPDGHYQVRVRANPADALAESATFTVPLTVRPVTLRRLLRQVDRLCADGAMSHAAAHGLRQALHAAVDARAAGNPDALARPLARAAALIEAERGRGIAPGSANDLACQLAAFRRGLPRRGARDTAPAPRPRNAHQDV
ncbi:hypothetical protein CKO28_06870 [Rhodovibrio sodomensis]|uniref:Uncharacterized protein n=2 Tax=Rhodovibrio sodomensis TaxID=1088 RepID=A0ABS1DC00_9PROT|nr:hypothetical protein [Rhodovibrio sodomensis]